LQVKGFMVSDIKGFDSRQTPGARTGETGIVVSNHERWLARPKLRVILDASGSPCEPFDRDLSERTSAGDFRWEARGSIDARTLGIDMLSLLASGELKTDDRSGTGPGLWHEPAPGEAAPEGYVEAHPQPHRAYPSAGVS